MFSSFRVIDVSWMVKRINDNRIWVCVKVSCEVAVSIRVAWVDLYCCSWNQSKLCCVACVIVLTVCYFL